MARTSKRQTLAPGVYRDHQCIEIRATSNGVTLTQRLPGDTSLPEAIRKRAQLAHSADTEHPRPAKHTLAADAPLYLRLSRTLHATTQRSRKAHLNAWIARLPTTPRHRIIAHDVLDARVAWLEAKVSPKTINHRVHTLKRLYKVLDGKRAPTPADDVTPLPVHRTPIQRVSDELILAVDAVLQRKEREATGNRRFDGAKTRARYRVLVSTGRRPSEIMRAQRTDVDLEQRVWVVRDGKGGWSPGVYLNQDMLAAWKLFIDADAWGEYSTSSFAKVIRRAGWPKTVRPYQARHTTWIMAVERGADMADVQLGAGHKSIATTRIYTGVRNSRMQGLSEALDGRFQGFPETPRDE